MYEPMQVQNLNYKPFNPYKKTQAYNGKTIQNEGHKVKMSTILDEAKDSFDDMQLQDFLNNDVVEEQLDEEDADTRDL